MQGICTPNAREGPQGVTESSFTALTPYARAGEMVVCIVFSGTFAYADRWSAGRSRVRRERSRRRKGEMKALKFTKDRWEG
jgi:hypothetical protein